MQLSQIDYTLSILEAVYPEIFHGLVTLSSFFQKAYKSIFSNSVVSALESIDSFLGKNIYHGNL